jgi:hypothetical protein
MLKTILKEKLNLVKNKKLHSENFTHPERMRGELLEGKIHIFTELIKLVFSSFISLLLSFSLSIVLIKSLLHKLK